MINSPYAPSTQLEPQITPITQITQIKPISAPRFPPWLVQLELTLRRVGENRRNRRNRRFKLGG